MGKQKESDLRKRKTEIEKEFDALAERRKALLEENKKLQQELAGVQTRQMQLQGAFAEIKAILGEEEVTVKK